ncbi:MAG: DUF4148 domain-containing protein [Burkholderiales bacterium]|nr:DUF4148 domain-containing protein [Burkholderiales bacterium]ODU68051.1 MAG: hypothetical protein ABT05_03085 [Lautropia sp. SCN 66-9]
MKTLINQLAAAAVLATLAGAATAAPVGEWIDYPGPVQQLTHKSRAEVRAEIGTVDTASPFVTQGEFVQRNPAYTAPAARSRIDVRNEGREAQKAHVGAFDPDYFG